jgi:hypothetical protein
MLNETRLIANVTHDWRLQWVKVAVPISSWSYTEIKGHFAGSRFSDMSFRVRYSKSSQCMHDYWQKESGILPDDTGVDAIITYDYYPHLAVPIQKNVQHYYCIRACTFIHSISVTTHHI